MSTHTPQQMKRVLLDAGFEVFRMRGDEIVLAERPRENLILDSGVRLKIGPPLEVRLVLRTQKADYPNEDEAWLFERARGRAARALEAGFVEVQATVAPVMDPGDPGRTLDTFYEILFAKSEPALEDALATLRFALSLEKRA